MPGIGGGGRGGLPRVGGFMQWRLPYGAPSAANWIAMMAMRHFHEFGTTREQLAWIALNARRNAALNPKAVYREPMSIDDYLGVRMVSSPLCLYDCDVPADGSTAVIVGRADARGDLRQPPVRVDAVGTAMQAARRGTSGTTSPRWRSATRPRAVGADRSDARRCRCRRAVRRLQLHHPVLARSARVLREGRGRRVRRGRRAHRRDGEVPLNTHGGQLSAGRLHGYGFLHEACVQLWGEGGRTPGRRQGGRQPEVAVAGAGGGPLAGCLLLTRG